jgi:hypothetical protein
MLFGTMTRSSVMSHYELRMNDTLFADGAAKDRLDRLPARQGEAAARQHRRAVRVHH